MKISIAVSLFVNAFFLNPAFFNRFFIDAGIYLRLNVCVMGFHPACSFLVKYAGLLTLELIPSNFFSSFATYLGSPLNENCSTNLLKYIASCTLANSNATIVFYKGKQ